MALFHPPIYGQASTQEPPASPAGEQIPEAVPVDQPPPGDVVRLEADHQSRTGKAVTLTGNVVVYYLDYVVRSQELVYDDATGTVRSAGKVQLDGGPDNEHISAASGDVQLKEGTAHFFNAVGTVSPPAKPVIEPPLGSTVPIHAVLASTSPFLFTAREVVKQGAGHYRMYGAVVTSCELPHPDWAFHVRRAEVDQQTAKMYDSMFTLVDVPLFYFPYATHAVRVDGRQTGFLLPILGQSSTKGLVLGEEFYWAINRSMDLQLGLDYYSIRGFAPLGQFRYKGNGLDFVTFRFTALKDRGQPQTGIDQGGADLILSGRHDFNLGPNQETRVVGNLEYLNSYIYRQAFAESFNLAVASEVKSDAFVSHAGHGYAAIVSADRYQNFLDTSGDQIRILHVPTLELDALDHSLGNSGFYWGARAAADGLERSEPGFSTSGVMERVDLYPHVGYLWHGAGWTLRPEVAGRETFYSRSALPSATTPVVLGGLPTEADSSLNRKDAEASVDLLPPALERDFQAANGWQWRHVIQPEFHYRFVGGIDKFQNVLRFDSTDITSDTNELKYGLAQRLYVRHLKSRPCKAGEQPPAGSKLCTEKDQETLRWFVGQKYFIDPEFGGAVVPDFRNVLQSTLDFSGTAYLTENRNVSPVISRLRWTSTQKIDAEWDVDYDTKRGDLLSSNVFVDFHQAEWFEGAGVAKLLEPAEVNVGALPPQAEDFLQVRWSLGYGGATKRGFSAATSGGYDVDANAVQYSVVQTGYNWDCCGFSAEYRRFALGSTRNENAFRFSFTLAGVGTAGNLRRAERLY